MPKDALTYSFIAKELDEKLSGSRIEKIYMPTPTEITLKCHKGKESAVLLISVAATNPRIHLTNIQKENPLTAPTFLMHLRKNIGNGTITSITAQQYERVITIEILSKNEFEILKRKIIVEVTGTYSNIILLNENDVISEALRHVTPDVTQKRLVLPELKYTPIPPQEKLKPSDEKLIDLITEFGGDRPDKYILSVMCGMAPSTITECVMRAIGCIRRINGKDEAKKIFKEINDIYCDFRPCLIKNNGVYSDYYTSPFCSVLGEIEYYPTLSECMDLFYKGKSDDVNLNLQIKRLYTIVKNAEKRTKKKLEDFIIKKSECMDFESDRIKGELITANIYKIKKGESAIEVFDYYSNNAVKISLDKNKSAAENAQAYYKKYAKKKNTLTALELQINESEQLLTKYGNALCSFDLCSSKSELKDIETELYQLKLLQNKEIKNRKKEMSSCITLVLDGYKIEIGKNNIQNERLYKSAAANDIWLHVLDAHGSHVIIRSEQKIIPEEIIICGAQLAAFYSKNKMADKVAVDYTFAKFVKPLPGGGPGRVNYTNQKTIYVSPKSVIDFN